MADFGKLRSFLGEVRIAHHIRGRIRLKLESRRASTALPQAQVRDFQARLDRIPGIDSVQFNLLARSCTVHYNCGLIPERAWGDLLNGVDSVAAATLERILLDGHAQVVRAQS